MFLTALTTNEKSHEPTNEKLLSPPPIVRTIYGTVAWGFHSFMESIDYFNLFGEHNTIKFARMIEARSLTTKDVQDLEKILWIEEMHSMIIGEDRLLHTALVMSNEKMVETLLTHGMQATFIDEHNATSLHKFAAYYNKDNNQDVFKLLLENGANIQAANSNGSTPLHIAAIYGNNGVFELLLNNTPDIEVKNIGGDTPLLLAVAHDNKRALQLLLEKGANPNQQNIHDNNTALYVAATRRHDDLVKLLLENGADLTATVQKSSKEVAKLLLEINLNLKCSDIYTFFSFACIYSKIKFYELDSYVNDFSDMLFGKNVEDDYDAL